MLSGEEKNLPPRDRGPVHRFARDYVDSRRSAAEFFLPIALFVLIATFIRNEVVYTLGILVARAALGRRGRLDARRPRTAARVGATVPQ